MNSNTPETQFDAPVESPNSFIHGSPTDEEIRLQALNHSKDKLLSIVGHDLRSAIGGVLAIVRMLDKRLEQNDVEDAKRLSGLIRKASLDADELLSDLVAWTRNSGQELKFRLESIDIQQLLATEVQRLQTTVDRKQKSGTSGEIGSGFGLLLCEDFIQRHGGHITWESALGEGSTFSFTIPELLG